MIIKTENAVMQSYLSDESGLPGGHAQTVYIPENENEFIELMKDLSKKKIDITISGAGTGVVGGRVPFGGCIISLEKFKEVFEIKRISDTKASVRVQAGITVKELKEYAGKHGWMYAPDPTEQNSSLGGNIATNASGSRGFKYGSTRKYVKSLKIVLSNGGLLVIDRGQYIAKNNQVTLKLNHQDLKIAFPGYYIAMDKNAAGYSSKGSNDLIDLFIGSEGTLGIILEAEVELLPTIGNIISGIAFFDRKENAWDFVDEVRYISLEKRGYSGSINALSVEYMDRNALKLLKAGYTQIPDTADAAILFEQDVQKESSETIIENWSLLIEKHGAPLESVWFGTSSKEIDLFRGLRHALPEKVNEIVRKNGFPKTGTDIAVPINTFSEMMQFYYEIFEGSGIDYLVFGHIGECHMHANLLPRSKDQFERCKELYIKLVKKAVQLGGTASAEHGIGKLKHKFLEIMVGNKGIRAMQRIKKTFDPDMILGKGNLFN